MKIKNLSLYNFVIESAIEVAGSKKANFIVMRINNDLDRFKEHLIESLFEKKGYFMYTEDRKDVPVSLNTLFVSLTEQEYTISAHKEIIYCISQYIKKKIL